MVKVSYVNSAHRKIATCILKWKEYMFVCMYASRYACTCVYSLKI